MDAQKGGGGCIRTRGGWVYRSVHFVQATSGPPQHSAMVFVFCFMSLLCLFLHVIHSSKLQPQILSSFHHHRHLRAPRPKDTMVLVVKVSHPEHGDYFLASLEARRSTVNASNETASIGHVVRYGHQCVWWCWERTMILSRKNNDDEFIHDSE